eukprot:5372137-Pleurochrysis_carterae.AAC.1
MLAHLSPRFSEKFCNHAPGTHNSDGSAYRTRAAQYYPTDMNAALVDAILALLPTAAAEPRDAGGGRRGYDRRQRLGNPLRNGRRGLHSGIRIE